MNFSVNFNFMESLDSRQTVTRIENARNVTIKPQKIVNNISEIEPFEPYSFASSDFEHKIVLKPNFKTIGYRQRLV